MRSLLSKGMGDKTYFGLFKVVGEFPNGAPRGVTVHYTASRNIGATVRDLSAKRLGYHFIIDRDGTTYQCAGTNQVLNHAGRSAWGDTLPNRDHVGVALISWGQVTWTSDEYLTTWCGVLLPVSEGVKTGKTWWHKATEAQEKSLLSLLKNLVDSGVPAKNICGHDECCIPKGRKIDPGGVVDVKKIRSLLANPARVGVA